MQEGRKKRSNAIINFILWTLTVTLGMLELGKQVAIRSMDEEKNKDDYEEI